MNEKDLKEQLNSLTDLQRKAYQAGYEQGQKDKEKELLAKEIVEIVEKAEKEEEDLQFANASKEEMENEKG